MDEGLGHPFFFIRRQCNKKSSDSFHLLKIITGFCCTPVLWQTQGNPLFAEALIPVGAKDLYNRTDPTRDEDFFLAFVQNPGAGLK